MHKNWRWFILGYLWSSLNTLLNLCVAVTLYRAHSFKWMEGVLTCIGGTKKNGQSRILGKPGGQGFGGCLVVYRDEQARGRADLRVHENCHVVQGFVLGPIFLFIYPLLFLVIWTYRRDGWKNAYRNSPFEEQAYTRQAAYFLGNARSWKETRWGHSHSK